MSPIHLNKLTGHPANIKVVIELHKSDMRDAPLQYTEPELVICSGDDGRFYAAVVRTGYNHKRARRELFPYLQVNDCTSGDEALQKLYTMF